MPLVVLPSRLPLPREMVACCLEFLSYPKLNAVMRVSPIFYSAASLLLRGRWRGVEYARFNYLSIRRSLRKIRTGGESTTGTLVLSAWQRDPGDLLLACLTWKNPKDLGCLRKRRALSGGRRMQSKRVEFLMLLEPSADSRSGSTIGTCQQLERVSRVVAACEHPYRTLRAMSRAISAMHRFERPGSVVALIHDWATLTFDWAGLIHDEFADDEEEGDDEVQRRICLQVARALEAWADPKLAARFMDELLRIVIRNLWRDHQVNDRRVHSGELGGVLTTFSVDWQDRSKAAAFAGTAGQIEADVAIEQAREDMLRQSPQVTYGTLGDELFAP